MCLQKFVAYLIPTSVLLLLMCRLDTPRMLENSLQAFLESVDVVVNKVLLMDLAFVDQAHQSQTLVNLSQVQHDVLCRVLVRESNKRT